MGATLFPAHSRRWIVGETWNRCRDSWLMNSRKYAIPGRLNLALASGLICVLMTFLWAAGQVSHWWSLGLLALSYGILMNTGYALFHEAEHNLFHPNKRINNGAGIALGFFFPAPF